MKKGKSQLEKNVDHNLGASSVGSSEGIHSDKQIKDAEEEVLPRIPTEAELVLPKRQSSNIRAYFYDQQTQIFYIAYLNGKLYAYKEVTPSLFDMLTICDADPAGSVGSWCYNHVTSKMPATRLK